MAETVATAQKAGVAVLREQGIDTAGLDARLLLQEVLNLDHAGLIADPQRTLSAEEEVRLALLLARRAAREPVSRILGWREFYGRRFAVSPAVLDPRPDSETLIDAALELARQQPVQTIIDLGTGSGILALTLLAEWPHARAVATDKSSAALAIARSNAEALGVAARLNLQEADWWQGVEGQFDLIVSNPPYIVAGEITSLTADVRNHDPLSALDGGTDGLECYRQIAGGLTRHLRDQGLILVEVGAGQAEDVKDIFFANGFNVLAERRDLGGHIRVLAFGAGQLHSAQKMV